LNRHGDYGNNDLECYTPDDSIVSGGNLATVTKLESRTCGDSQHAASEWKYTSATVQSTFSYTYGTLEFRAKLPSGRGAWPAIWLLGANCQQSNISTADNVGTCSWPDPGSDEIDVTEILGNSVTQVNQQLHSAGHNDGCTATTSDVSIGFHVYQLVWRPGSLVWTIDGVQTCSLSSFVPAQPMFIIIGTAVGGVGGGTVDDSAFPQSMLLDYVKVTP
jgi:beta-glucanase (GH16 family)